jgi:phosphatidylserine/phosphatidylglycerophosphate/cardiolipin synthase-like enzyme
MKLHVRLLKVSVFAVLAVLFNFGPIALSTETPPPLFFTPVTQGQTDVLAGLTSAKSSIHMFMYRVTDPQILSALIDAKSRGVDVKVILDKNSAEHEKPNGPSTILTEGGVEVRRSSAKFSISHGKTFLVDGERAYIMTLNLTKIASVVRDAGLITGDEEVVGYLEKLFQADWKNANEDGDVTPDSIPENLVISPVNASEKLQDLIDSAKSELRLVVENLSYQEIIDELIEAHQRGVHVEVLLPRCNMGESEFNLPAAQKLDAAGIDVRLMPGPETADMPYIHQKSIIADDSRAFLGSENDSYNSIVCAREIGILFDEARQIRQLTETFDEDFDKSMNYSEAKDFQCPDRGYGKKDRRDRDHGNGGGDGGQKKCNNF